MSNKKNIFLILLTICFSLMLFFLNINVSNAENDSEDIQSIKRQIEDPLAPLKIISKKIKELRIEQNMLTRRIENADNIEGVQKRKNTLQQYQNKINTLERKLYYSFEKLEVTISQVIFDWALYALILPIFFFLIVSRYIWIHKKHKLIAVDFSNYRMDFIKKIFPDGVISKNSISSLISIMLIAMVILLIFFPIILYAQDKTPVNDIALWKLKKQSFNEDVGNVSDLIAIRKDKNERLLFVLNHPLQQTINLYNLGFITNDDGIVFYKKPAIICKLKTLQVNSFEHIFLIGRLSYELNRSNQAFEYFNRISSLQQIKKHPFINPKKGQELLLNMLEISYLEEYEFKKTESMFLQFGTTKMKFELVVFLAKQIDIEKSLKLFKQIIAEDLACAVTTAKIIGKNEGFQKALPFFNVIYEQVSQTKEYSAKVFINDLMTLLINENILSATKQKYIELLQKSLNHTDNIGEDMVKAYILLLNSGKTSVVTIKLNTLFENNKVLQKNVNLYIQWLNLYLHVNKSGKYNTYLEKAWKEYFSSLNDMNFLLNYCLKNNKLSQASEILTKMMTKYPEIKTNKISDKFQHYLTMPLPSEYERLSIIGFAGLLHYMIKNKNECKLSLEEAIKTALNSTLANYGKSIDINFNEIYYLLKTYLELEQMEKIKILLPIYEYLVQNNLAPVIDANQNKLNMQRKTVDKLKQNLLGIAADKKAFEENLKSLKESVDLLETDLILAKVKRIFLYGGLTFFGVIIVTCIALILFYAFLRSWHFAILNNTWKTGVFYFRFSESIGFCLCMTIFFAPIGIWIIVISQILLSILYPTTQLNFNGEER